MLSIIIFLIGCLITISTSLVCFIDTMKWTEIVNIAISLILGMIVINALVAAVCCKLLPKKWFSTNSKFFNPSKKECKFYEKIGIRKWKDWNIDLGQLNGFKKDRIENNPDYIKRFIVESNMGFFEHFLSLFVSVLVIFMLPIKFWLPTALPIVITSLILNIMPIMILRYNIPRLKILLKYCERKKDI